MTPACAHGKVFVCVDCIMVRPISPELDAAARAATVRIDADRARRASLTSEQRNSEDEQRIARLAHDLSQFTD